MAFNLDKITKENKAYRNVIYTTSYQQLVLMCIEPNDFIPEEVHEYNDQFIKVEEGELEIMIDDLVYLLKSGDSITIPSKSRHRVNNRANISAKLYTIYSPPHHSEGTYQPHNVDKWDK